jgi:preprotein translocase subunit SecG
MYPFVLGVHVFVCVLLIISILLQSGKGSDLGSAFGAGSSSEMLGGASPVNIMNRITTVLVIVFMFTSISLTIMSGKSSKSIIDKLPAQHPTTQGQPKLPVK